LNSNICLGGAVFDDHKMSFIRDLFCDG